MIQFLFDVNESFLKDGLITIKKKCYTALHEQGFLTEDDYRILFPSGRSEIAYIYSGVAGWGPYYQIRLRNRPSTLPVEEFHKGQRLTVKIERQQWGQLSTITLSVLSDVRDVENLLGKYLKKDPTK